MADAPVTDTSRHGPTARSQRFSSLANVCGLMALLDLVLGIVLQTKWGGLTDILYVALVLGILLCIAKAQQIRASGQVEYDYRAGPETRLMKIRATFRKFFTIQICGTIPIALFLMAMAHIMSGDTILPFMGPSTPPPNPEAH